MWQLLLIAKIIKCFLGKKSSTLLYQENILPAMQAVLRDDFLHMNIVGKQWNSPVGLYTRRYRDIKTKWSCSFFSRFLKLYMGDTWRNPPTLLVGWHEEPQSRPPCCHPNAGSSDPAGPSGFQVPCQRSQRQTPESLWKAPDVHKHVQWTSGLWLQFGYGVLRLGCRVQEGKSKVQLNA